MTPGEWGQGLAGLGIVVMVAYTTFNSAVAKRSAKTAAGVTEAVQATLTTTNGGSHVKDALNRLEDGIAGLREDFRDHKTDSARAEAHIFERLERLERRRPRFPFLT